MIPPSLGVITFDSDQIQIYCFYYFWGEKYLF